MVREVRRFIPLRKIARGKLDLSEGINIDISPSFMQSFFIIPKKNTIQKTSSLFYFVILKRKKKSWKFDILSYFSLFVKFES